MKSRIMRRAIIVAALALVFPACDGDPTNVGPQLQLGTYDLIRSNGEDLPRMVTVEWSGSCYWIEEGTFSLTNLQFTISIKGERIDNCKAGSPTTVQFFQGDYMLMDSILVLNAINNGHDLYAEFSGDTAMVEVDYPIPTLQFADLLNTYTFVLRADEQ